MTPAAPTPVPPPLNAAAAEAAKVRAVMDYSKPRFKLGTISTILALALIAVAVFMPPAGLPASTSILIILGIALVRFVVGVGIAALLAYAAYFCFSRSPRVGAAVFCTLVSLQILGVIATSGRINGDRSPVSASTEQFLNEVDRQRDSAIAAVNAQTPQPAAAEPSPAPASAAAPASQAASRGNPVVRVYRRP